MIISVASNLMGWVSLYKGEIRIQIRKGNSCKDTGKKRQPYASQSERPGFGGGVAADTLISHFKSPELLESTFMLFKSPSL